MGPRPSFSPHTQGRNCRQADRQADRQTDRQTDRQADCQLTFCFALRSFTLRVTIAAPSPRGPRTAKFWQTLLKNSKVLLASLPAFPYPDKGVRGAGLGQIGAPRAHSATELSQVINLKQKQTKRGQGGKGQDTDTRVHAEAQTPTCTNSRGTAGSEVGKFATTMLPHEAF